MPSYKVKIERELGGSVTLICEVTVKAQTKDDAITKAYKIAKERVEILTNATSEMKVTHCALNNN